MSDLPRRTLPTSPEFIAGIRAGNRMLLARAITLAESRLPAHQTQAAEILRTLLPETGRSIRIGITGYPGAGKSTLIESLGLDLLAAGHRLAILAIDPSSGLSHGSILGDKTRMEALTRDPRCFIRPSPSGGHLGGVARHTREALLFCEAAGYDVILIETVGIGQSEVLVRSMVDFFLLVLIAGAGDELQGIKKGVMEMVDAVVVNKADGDNLPRARAAAGEYQLALKYLTPATPGWSPPVQLVSALERSGLDTLWQTILAFQTQARAQGSWDSRRQRQLSEWLDQALIEALQQRFFQHPHIQRRLPEIQQQLLAGQLLVPEAVTTLLQVFDGA